MNRARRNKVSEKSVVLKCERKKKEHGKVNEDREKEVKQDEEKVDC
jgi:hypothetical protein